MLMLLRSRDSSLKEMKSDAFASFIPRSHRTTKTQKKAAERDFCRLHNVNPPTGGKRTRPIFVKNV